MTVWASGYPNGDNIPLENVLSSMMVNITAEILSLWFCPQLLKQDSSLELKGGVNHLFIQVQRYHNVNCISSEKHHRGANLIDVQKESSLLYSAV